MFQKAYINTPGGALHKEKAISAIRGICGEMEAVKVLNKGLNIWMEGK